MRTSFASFLLSAILLLGLSACTNDAPSENANTTSESLKANEEQPRAITVSLKEDGLAIGEKAPNFKLENVDGEFYSLDDIKDANGQKPKGFIVTFTCNTCPIAQKYEDRLIKLHNMASAMGYPLIAIQPNDPGISAGDSMGAMKKRAKDRSYPFVYLMDAKQEIYPQYGARRTPEIYLLDSDHILRYHGAVDDNVQAPQEVSVNYVLKAIEALENGQNPDPADVKAIGCTIKAAKS
ncbi:thioredoxin family protein [Flavilitoribacter nigricans]|uniref:Thioredoxin family protein n=1 Tax=Flavilitoribacter nigricans (strain ATCC 23147 / DSM 23189 / NBRC 102662 / NCIMB 1420 / SS-2) TaxID=1122177 RepID=A0A2D0NL90_FLAN2|nr:thioredoxin family protein [Flavilitoribacter nigricans]PHN08503.1 thioredoxin family protein [Flavilitoribacter nigricans DSM 23189 = NBRC 102662]